MTAYLVMCTHAGDRWIDSLWITEAAAGTRLGHLKTMTSHVPAIAIRVQPIEIEDARLVPPRKSKRKAERA